MDGHNFDTKDKESSSYITIYISISFVYQCVIKCTVEVPGHNKIEVLQVIQGHCSSINRCVFVFYIKFYLTPDLKHIQNNLKSKLADLVKTFFLLYEKYCLESDCG